MDWNIVSADDIIHLIRSKDDYCRLVLTGRSLPAEIAEYADVISKIELEKDLLDS